MDFTREPIIETIITPKEGCKLVVRSSKGGAQEEYFVDAVQVISYGNAYFFRSLERPKAFLVPVSDYEVLEVREARMVLKNVGVERTIKIGGGRETGKVSREREPTVAGEEPDQMLKVAATPAPIEAQRGVDRKRDRRRQGRRRRGREEQPQAPSLQRSSEAITVEPSGEPSVQPPVSAERETTTGLTSILPPPSQLISETLQQYRGNELFKDIFSRSADEAPTEELPS